MLNIVVLRQLRALTEYSHLRSARSVARTRLMQESAKSVDSRVADLMDQVQALGEEQRFTRVRAFVQCP